MNDEDNRIVEKLIEVYKEEEALYRRFISLTEKLAELAVKDTPPSEINQLVADREACLRAISELEKSIDSEKEIWQKEKGGLPGNRQGLTKLVDKIQEHIERSLKLDKQIESDIRTRLGSLKSELDHLHRTRKAHKAYLKRDEGPQTGITRARA